MALEQQRVDMEFSMWIATPPHSTPVRPFTLPLGLPCCMRSLPGLSPGRTRIRYDQRGQRAIQGARLDHLHRHHGYVEGEATFSGTPRHFIPAASM